MEQIPYQINKASLVEKIAELVESKVTITNSVLLLSFSFLYTFSILSKKRTMLGHFGHNLPIFAKQFDSLDKLIVPMFIAELISKRHIAFFENEACMMCILIC